MYVPDFASVPVWVWIAGGVVLVGLTVGGWFLWRLVYRRLVRRHIVGMVARRERLEASRRAVETVLERLAHADDEALLSFVQDSESVDRRVFHEVEERMRILRDELDHMRLPERVIPVAQAVADAAHVIAVEAGRVTDGMAPDVALDALSSVSLDSIARELEEMQKVLDAACREYEVEEAAVYGGGLYI